MYSVERTVDGWLLEKRITIGKKESHSQKRSKQQKTLFFILKGKLTKEHTKKHET